jgi:hypothetical protein
VTRIEPAASAKKTPWCGAKTRRGGTCRKWHLQGKQRCKLHGGASTGPRTAAGRARIAAAHYKHGRFTKQQRDSGREIWDIMRSWRSLQSEIREHRE